MIQCLICKTQNRNTELFCKECGQKLPQLTPAKRSSRSSDHNKSAPDLSQIQQTASDTEGVSETPEPLANESEVAEERTVEPDSMADKPATAIAFDPSATQTFDSSESPDSNVQEKTSPVVEEQGPKSEGPSDEPAAEPSAPANDVASMQPGAEEDPIDQPDPILTCAYCHTENEVTYRYCRACGKPLPALPESEGGLFWGAGALPEHPSLGSAPKSSDHSALSDHSTRALRSVAESHQNSPGPSPTRNILHVQKESPVSGESPAQLSCPVCGKLFDPPLRFCKDCGTRLVAIETAPTTCPGCGQPLDAADRFCRFCGHELPGTTGPRLVVTMAGKARVYPLSHDTLTIGRLPDNEIVISMDAYISGHHARVATNGEEATIEDAGSTNGTFFRVRQRTVLTDGDEIKVGQTILKFQK